MLFSERSIARTTILGFLYCAARLLSPRKIKLLVLQQEGSSEGHKFEAEMLTSTSGKAKTQRSTHYSIEA